LSFFENFGLAANRNSESLISKAWTNRPLDPLHFQEVGEEKYFSSTGFSLTGTGLGLVRFLREEVNRGAAQVYGVAPLLRVTRTFHFSRGGVDNGF